MKPNARISLVCTLLVLFSLTLMVYPPVISKEKKTIPAYDAKKDVGKGDWSQFGGSNSRNNTPAGKNIPTKWDVEKGTNILWKAKLGSLTYGNPVVANGKVYIGTNNGAGYLKRYPNNVDLGCLLCFEEKTGKFLWQHSSIKLYTGRVHDWPMAGVCSSPCIDGKRLWFVSNRGVVFCLDTEGFVDNKNNGPYKHETNENKNEADVIWKFDMMSKLKVSQHNMSSCSVICVGEVLLVNTSNGMDNSHINLPSPNAPSFIAMDRNTGKVLWTDKSPSNEILHGQWSSPAFAVINNVPQAIFAGGDGWLYSFDPVGDGKGNAKLHWKFDCNPKDSKWILGGRGTRNNLPGIPVIYDGNVYCAVGQDPEHGEGSGHLWCINPNKKGDVSPTLAVDAKGKPLKRRRVQYVDKKKGEKILPNKNSAVVWHYEKRGEEFEEQMHRTFTTAAIKDDILYIADFSGLIHCLNAKTGKEYWSYDLFAAVWSSPLIVDGKVYIGDEDGDIAIFKHSKKKMLISEMNMNNSGVYTTPIVANNVLYIANKSTLYAIKTK